MKYDDIVSLEITPVMLEAANKDSEFLIRQSQTTRAATESRDIVGSLAHQAVENQLNNLDLAYQSTRLDRIKYGGDRGDIFYEQDIIDVKGTRGELNGWFFNQQFLVFDNERPTIEAKGITHFCFVLVDLPRNLAHIFGVIPVTDFYEKSVPVKLTWENHGIRSRHLRPFNKYAWRV